MGTILLSVRKPHKADIAESLQRMIFKQKVLRNLRNWKRIITKKKTGMIENSGGSNIFKGLNLQTLKGHSGISQAHLRCGD